MFPSVVLGRYLGVQALPSLLTKEERELADLIRQLFKEKDWKDMQSFWADPAVRDILNRTAETTKVVPLFLNKQ